MTDSKSDEAREGELRTAIATGVPEIAAMTPGRTGNLSARSGDRVAITPSGVPYEEIQPGSVPVLSLDGESVIGDLAPSSETPMHLGIYRSLDVGAIAHVHSPWATTLAVLGEELPPVHYMVAAAGGPIPVAPYEPFGTVELAEAAVSTMESAGTTACILANHGLVAGGEDVQDAIETAVAVESTAQVYLQAKAVGDPVELTPAQFEGAMAQFDSYGQPERNDAD
ncbi:class II aldolase [Halodesulfurarchaeum formicicum]|uniref:Class II aldolase n=1 Tax=Halodesulfurarchaeum formicicum TaxID=1873524 RepID=A0A1D8S4E7_9EURY|nr:class II aldolase/adducin family protein [Halodesulfurarchaeum formicicum]AOW80229.1 class II aldolase [Halodesulfurarchaeum formicicum]APE95530.1 class II aldolase [Halodesulfurarchaeum formicicum]